MDMIVDILKKSVPERENRYKGFVREKLAKAGVAIDGNAPWDIQVNDDSFYAYLFKRGSLALGESYMYGLWDTEHLDELMFRILKANLENELTLDLRTLKYSIESKLFNNQSIGKAQKVAKRHYDIGNDLFEAMLDKRMIYSCGYWKNSRTLEEAQENKLQLICKKLKLERGHRVLDIGCGWGGFARYAAEKYGVEVVGITISRMQADLARVNCADLPVEIKFQDYRSLAGKFDRVVSIGMFEHVDYKNHSEFMKVVNSVLKDDGLFLLHTIGGNYSVKYIDPWINEYIFPNAVIPSVAQIGKAIEGSFVMEDWHNFGLDYDLTLLEWLRRFKCSWQELSVKYDQQFFRMWVYYLSVSAASFRSKKNNLWQIILSPANNLNAYESVR